MKNEGEYLIEALKYVVEHRLNTWHVMDTHRNPQEAMNEVIGLGGGGTLHGLSEGNPFWAHMDSKGPVIELTHRDWRERPESKVIFKWKQIKPYAYAYWNKYHSTKREDTEQPIFTEQLNLF
jgi:hypothetical protein